MAILDFDKSVWESAFGADLERIPDVLILEGTWWRERACQTRLSKLTDVIELPFPDMFVGRHGAATVGYCCAYGAARAVEPSHVFAQLGTPLLIQIGTCGVMTPDIPAGAVAVPRTAAARDGVSPYYGANETVVFDAQWCARAEALLRDAGCTSRNTRHLTWPSLFAQSDEMCASWSDEGLETVDMEASVVAAVATRFDRASLALLCTWDELSDGRTFLDPLPEHSQAALDHANKATFDVALSLALEFATDRQAKDI